VAALKKLAFTAKWNTVKDLADKNWKKDVAKRQKENKDDKAELKYIADNAKEWKQMYAKNGLSCTQSSPSTTRALCRRSKGRAVTCRSSSAKSSKSI